MDRLIGVVVAGILLALGVGYVGAKAYEGFNGTYLSEAVSDATYIAQHANQVYGGSAATGPADYSSLNTQVGINAGIVPNTMYTDADKTTIHGPWSGSAVRLSGDTSNIYEYWDNIPAGQCAAFAVSQKVSTVSVNGTAVSMQGGKGASGVTAACNSGNFSKSNLVFTFSAN